MWVFTNNSFISAVEDEIQPDMVVVRARIKDDLESFFNDFSLDVKETPRRDYRFRTIVSKEKFAETIKQHALNIDYDNFKDSVENNERYSYYTRVWNVMFTWQEKIYQNVDSWWLNYRNRKYYSDYK